MVYLVFNILFAAMLPIAAGVIALVRGSKAPSGKGLAFAGGGLLVITGLIAGAWALWYELVARPVFQDSMAGFDDMPAPEWVFDAYAFGRPLLTTVACALLLFAVLSARGKQAAPQGAPVPAYGGPRGYGPQPGQTPGQGHPAQQGPQQHHQGNPTGPQQGQQPHQANPTGPQQPHQPQSPGGPQQGQGQYQPQQPQQPQPPNPYQQPPRRQRPRGNPTGPQQPNPEGQQPQNPGGPQQPRPGSHRRPPQPPEGDPSGPR